MKMQQEDLRINKAAWLGITTNGKATHEPKTRPRIRTVGVACLRWIFLIEPNPRTKGQLDKVKLAWPKE